MYFRYFRYSNVFKYTNNTIEIQEGNTGGYYNNCKVKIWIRRKMSNNFLKWHKRQILITKMFRVPGWLSWFSVCLLILAQVTISQWWDQAPCQALLWQSREHAWGSLSPSSLSLSLSLSLSPKINKYFLKTLL